VKRDNKVSRVEPRRYICPSCHHWSTDVAWACVGGSAAYHCMRCVVRDIRQRDQRERDWMATCREETP